MSSGRVRRLRCNEVEQILVRHGFVFVSQEGSHRKWRNREEHLQVIVPSHAGQVLPIGTLRNIFLNAKIPEEEWRE